MPAPDATHTIVSLGVEPAYPSQVLFFGELLVKSTALLIMAVQAPYLSNELNEWMMSTMGCTSLHRLAFPGL